MPINSSLRIISVLPPFVMQVQQAIYLFIAESYRITEIVMSCGNWQFINQWKHVAVRLVHSLIDIFCYFLSLLCMCDFFVVDIYSFY